MEPRGGMSTFTDGLTVQRTGTRTWVVQRPFIYHVGAFPSPLMVPVEAGYETDLASVPRVLWWALRPDGTWAQAAVVHDKLCYEGWGTDRLRDAVFEEAMRVAGVPRWRRLVLFYGVRLGAALGFNTRRWRTPE